LNYATKEVIYRRGGGIQNSKAFSICSRNRGGGKKGSCGSVQNFTTMSLMVRRKTRPILGEASTVKKKEGGGVIGKTFKGIEDRGKDPG